MSSTLSSLEVVTVKQPALPDLQAINSCDPQLIPLMQVVMSAGG